MGTRLFIGNLSYNVTEQELREAFTGEGIELRSVRVALDRETGRPRGFAFVETATDDGAKASIEKLSGRILQGRPIIVGGGASQAGGAAPGGRLRERPATPRWRRLQSASPRGGRPGGPPPRSRRTRWLRRRPPRPGGGPGGPPRDFGPPRGSGRFQARGLRCGAGCAPQRGSPPPRASRKEAFDPPQARGTRAGQLALGRQGRRVEVLGRQPDRRRVRRPARASARKMR